MRGVIRLTVIDSTTWSGSRVNNDRLFKLVRVLEDWREPFAGHFHYYPADASSQPRFCGDRCTTVYRDHRSRRSPDCAGACSTCALADRPEGGDRTHGGLPPALIAERRHQFALTVPEQPVMGLAAVLSRCLVSACRRRLTSAATTR
jgi:hypothetical protein